MSASFLDRIDWNRPWLIPLRMAAAPIVRSMEWRQALNAAAGRCALHNHRGFPVRFVPQAELPVGTAYESFISATGGVPTRDNLHDFFNALIWLTFPKIKAQLNAMQAQEIANCIIAKPDVSRHGVKRGKIRDAATIFDENAALLVVRDGELVEALRDHRWQELFLSRRTAFERDCEVWLFGHALMEKLVSPYKSITAHALVVEADQAFFGMTLPEKRGWIDSITTRRLERGLDTSDFTPLPVLGVPGWWECQNEMFYQDAAVFRPKRRTVWQQAEKNG
jgi:hypothetical protein